MSSNLKNLFPNIDDRVALNHGSYGLLPNCIRNYLNKIRCLHEDNFLSYIDNGLIDDYQNAVCCLAKLIGCDSDDVVFVRNVTTAMEIALSSIERAICANYCKVKRIVTTNHEYTSTKIMLKHYAEKWQVDLVVIDIDDLTTKQISHKVLQIIDKDDLLLISHITSPHAELIDITTLVNSIYRDCICIVDCAHTVGSLEIAKEIFGKAIFCFTLHKWGYFPRGVGALSVPNNLKCYFKPLVHSWFYDDDFNKRFLWTGTEDIFPYLVANKCFQFKQYLDSNWDRGLKLKNYVRKRLNSVSKLQAIKANDEVSNMLSYYFLGDKDDFARTSQILKEANIEVWFGIKNEQIILRISLAPYTSIIDIEKLVNKLNI